MRKLLFYTWCIGGTIIFSILVRWGFRSIAEAYGVGVMLVAVTMWLAACLLIGRRIDRADAIAVPKAGYMREREPKNVETVYLRLRDDSKRS